MSVLIITGGRLDEDFALDFLKREHYDHIIVVDGALALWDRITGGDSADMNFDHLVGDFDTIDHRILAKYLDRKDITVHRFNPVKDNTDTDIAIGIAEDLCENSDDKRIILIGATGTRLDHVLGNFQLLELIADQGCEGQIVDRNNRITLFRGHKVVKKQEQYGKYISLIPITDTLEHLTLTGLKYPLSDYTVRRGPSLCVSNEITADEAVFDMKSGLAYMIESKD